MKFTIGSRAIAHLALSLSLVVAAGIATAQYNGTGPLPAPTSGKLKALSKKVSQPSRIYPRKFFPRIQHSVSPKNIKPENPSRFVTFPGDTTPGLGGVSGGAAKFNPFAGGKSPFNPSGPTGTGSVPPSGKPGGIFPGISSTGFAPPDTSAAAGPNYIVEVVNVSIAFFEKATGTKVFEQTFDDAGFLNGTGVGATPFSFDPRVCFDRVSGRFYAITLDVDFNNSVSSFILCVSTTGDPNDPWDFYRIDNTFDAGGGNFFWGDYPQIGFSDTFIMVSTNLFPFASGGAIGTQFQVIDKASVLGGGPAVSTTFSDTTRFNARPSRKTSAAAAPCYAVNYSGSGGGNSQYRIYAASGPGNAPVLDFADVVTPGTATGNPGGAPSKGFNIDNLGTRLMDSSFANGRLAFVHTLAVGGGDTRNSIRWTELNTNGFPVANPTLRQTGQIILPSPEHALQPSVELNATSDMSILFTRTLSGTTPDVMVATRTDSDPLGFLDVPFQVAASPDFPAGGGGTNRWGDYSSVCIDPTDDTIFWGCNELAASPDMFDWTTAIVKWQVLPTGVGGNHPESVTTLFGTTAGGNVASFAAEDSDLHLLDSEAVDGRGSYAAYELQFASQVDKATISRMTIGIKASVVGPNTPGFLYILNADTGVWEMMLSTRFTTTLNMYTIRIPNGKAAPYVDANGKVKVRVMAIQANRRKGGITPSFRLQSEIASISAS